MDSFFSGARTFSRANGIKKGRVPGVGPALFSLGGLDTLLLKVVEDCVSAFPSLTQVSGFE